MTLVDNNQTYHTINTNGNPLSRVPHQSSTRSQSQSQGIIDVTSTSSPSSPNTHNPNANTPSPTNTGQSQLIMGRTKPKRHSWFSLRRTKQLLSSGDSHQSPINSIPEESDKVTPSPPPSAWNGNSSLRGNTERLRPIQFQPNRIQTLYVTKSERDLYLAAMSQLDQLPPPLPLWSDSPPELPKLNTQLTPLKAPSIPSGSTRGGAVGHSRSISEGGSTAFHPLTSRPLSPKLVTSPQMGRSGLMIRDEFRRVEPPKQSKHALMAFTLPSGLRFTGFPSSVISAVDLVLQENWDEGISARSEGADELSRRTENDKFTWKVELEGKVWKRKGSQELDPIRLLIALFSILGIHGWTLVENVQAGGTKKDAHNLLFSYSAETSLNPPLFFALSIPLPDRLSLISPPPKVTPAIISALREAIVSSPANSHKHARNATAATAATGVTVTSDSNGSDDGGRSRSPKFKWKGYDPRGIKLEGWVHDGVYRFWIDGMRRWLGGTVKRKVVENLHPNLLISIINNITNLHFELTASIPLLPITKGRDVLIFSSLPSSGLSVVDSYVPKAPSIAGTESPVLVSDAASLPAQEILDNPRDVDPGNRQLPWTSVLNEQPRPPSPSKSSRPPPSANTPASDPQRKRTASRESTKPLLAAPSASANSTPTPKHKNLLLKKNSLTRRRSVSANASNDHASRQPSESGRNSSQGQYTRHSIDGRGSPREHVYGQGTGEDNRHFQIMNPDNSSKRWSFIEPPPNVGKLGVTMFDTTGGHSNNQYLPTNTNDQHDRSVPRISADEGTRESNEESIYADAQPTFHPRHNGHHGEYDYHSQHEPLNYVPIQNEIPSKPAHTTTEVDNSVGRGILLPTSTESELGFGSDLDPSQPLALGQPLNQSDHHDEPIFKTVPLSDSDSPERRGRQNLVNLELGSAIQSVHGSVGYLQSMVSGISGHHGPRSSIDLDNLQQHHPVPFHNQGEVDKQENQSTVPRPEIKIISSSPSPTKHREVVPPPLPNRPHPDTIPSSTLPQPSISVPPTSGFAPVLPPRTHPSEEEKSKQRNKYQEWEKKGKVKEGMRRIWDENDNSWKDIPLTQNQNPTNQFASGNGEVRNEGVGSGRTKISLGRDFRGTE